MRRETSHGGKRGARGPTAKTQSTEKEAEANSNKRKKEKIRRKKEAATTRMRKLNVQKVVEV